MKELAEYFGVTVGTGILLALFALLHVPASWATDDETSFLDEPTMCGETLPESAIVVVASSTCAPCRRFGRALREEISTNNSAIREENVTFVYLDCRSCAERNLYAARSGDFTTRCASANGQLRRLVQTTPTVLIVNEGQLVWSSVGAPEVSELAERWAAAGSN